MLTRLKEIAYDNVAKKFVTRDTAGHKIEVPIGGGGGPAGNFYADLSGSEVFVGAAPGATFAYPYVPYGTEVDFIEPIGDKGFVIDAGAYVIQLAVNAHSDEGDLCFVQPQLNAQKETVMSAEQWLTDPRGNSQSWSTGWVAAPLGSTGYGNNGLFLLDYASRWFFTPGGLHTNATDMHLDGVSLTIKKIP